MKYYIVSGEDAVRLNVTQFRRGNMEKGYVVTAGDLRPIASEENATWREVTEREALNFIKEL